MSDGEEKAEVVESSEGDPQVTDELERPATEQRYSQGDVHAMDLCSD